jgi:hypothetical protein
VSSEELFIIEGDGSFVKVEKLKVTDACGSTNVICVCFGILESSEIIVCGGADKYVRGFSKTNGNELFSLELSAPVLSLDSFGTLIAASCMDGSHAYFDTTAKVW